MRRHVLFLALFFSGAASLVYQVAWTRRLLAVTSATAAAQAFVLAVFMAGLGLGSALAGRRAARSKRPVLAYAIVEVAAAAFALGAFVAIDASSWIRTALLQAGALHTAVTVQLLVLALYLLVPTTLLGSSLPLLIEHAERTTRASGERVSIAYGINTAGAAIGCLLAGFVTIERYGLVRTTAIGGALAVAAAAIAIVTTRGTRDEHEHEHEHEHEPLRQGVASGTIDRMTIVAAALAGYAGISAEVVWTRLFALVVPNTVYTFTQVLAAVLVGIALGAWAAGFVARRARNVDPDESASAITLTISLLGAGAAMLMAVVPPLVVRFADDGPIQRSLASGRSLGAALVILGCVIPPTALVAAVLPLLVVTKEGGAARRFGGLYAANVVGSVAGSILTGFVVIPVAGIKLAAAHVEAVAVVLAILMFTRVVKSARGRIAPFVLGSALACLALHFSHDVPRAIFEKKVEPGVTVRDFREGASSHVMVTDDARGERRLWINSFWVAGSAGPHRVFGLLPGLFVDEPKYVLGIALGTGQTFAAAKAHGPTQMDCVEIDEGVVALSRKWFAEQNHHVLDDPNVRVVIDDGRAFMRATAGAGFRYEMIVLEPLQAWSAGTSSLYAREFYVDAKRALTDKGVLAQWIPFYGQGPEETRAMVRAAIDVFPQASLWLSGRDGVLVLSNDTFTLDLAAMQRRIDERKLAPLFAPLPAHDAEDLLPFLLLGPEGLARWTAGAPLLVDDRPFLEFRAARQIGTEETHFRDILRGAVDAIDPIEPYVLAPKESAPRIAAIAKTRRALFELDAAGTHDLAHDLEVLGALPDGAHDLLVWQKRYRIALYAGVRAYAGAGRISEARALLEHATTIPPLREEAARALLDLTPPGPRP